MGNGDGSWGRMSGTGGQMSGDLSGRRELVGMWMCFVGVWTVRSKAEELGWDGKKFVGTGRVWANFHYKCQSFVSSSLARFTI